MPRLTPEEFDRWLERTTRVETTRASGPGGQHRNKRDTAVRLVHEPSGVRAGASEQRSQKANRDAAWRRLRQRVLAHYTASTDRERAPSNEVVRTYREVDDRVLDHASGIERAWSATVAKGNLDELIDARRMAVAGAGDERETVQSGRV